MRRWFGLSATYLHIVLAKEFIAIEKYAGDPLIMMDAVELETIVAVQGSGEKRVIAVGRASIDVVRKSQPNVEVRCLTEHPRVLAGDFSLYQQALATMSKRFHRRFELNPPTVILHRDCLTEGGLTSIEVRALIELGETFGGKIFRVRTGRRLTDQDFRRLETVRDGWHDDPLGVYN